MKAVIGQEPWLLDPLVVRKKWDEDAYQLVEHGRGKPLCFAFMETDGIVEPHPPVQRALKMTAVALQAAGHKGRSCHSLGRLLAEKSDSDSVEALQTEGDVCYHGKRSSTL